MIRIDPEGGSVHIELDNGASVQIDGLPAASQVECDEQHALFLSPEEADVLAKMIDYITDKVKIRQESLDALRAVRPRLDTLFSE